MVADVYSNPLQSKYQKNADLRSKISRNHFSNFVITYNGLNGIQCIILKNENNTRNFVLHQNYALNLPQSLDRFDVCRRQPHYVKSFAGLVRVNIIQIRHVDSAVEFFNASYLLSPSSLRQQFCTPANSPRGKRR